MPYDYDSYRRIVPYRGAVGRYGVSGRPAADCRGYVVELGRLYEAVYALYRLVGR